MQIAPLPTTESTRVATLRLLKILDTAPEERFDRLTRIAKRLFSVPIVLISLVDTNRQWFKSCLGLEVRETSRENSFCAHAILGQGLLLIPDTLLDERFFDNPLVTGEPHIRFYAGHAIKMGGENLGTLCLIDTKPRDLDVEERRLLEDLAEIVEQEIASLALASTGDLTTLSNRRGFEVLSGHTLNICKRMSKPATLLLLDLDCSRRVSGTMDPATGDEAARVLARGLLSVLRASDVIARLGADEFAVLLTGAPIKAAPLVVNRLKDWLASEGAAAGRGYEVQFSVRQIEYDPGVHRSIGDLLAGADALRAGNEKRSRVGGH